MHSDAGQDEQGLPVGFRVGDYVVKESVAAGGFGSVYRVEHVTQGTQAALKVLHRELASTPEAVLRFEREVEVVRRLHHPNVVEIFDSGRLADGRPYFVMELLVGVDLDTHMRSKRRLPPTDILAILESLCSALSLAHERGIIHRDLKAPNVFLTARDGKRRVVLLDFGVAKVLNEQGPGLTAVHHTVGTPFCMAPEQILGFPTDARTDIYALGVLSYYMLTGELPFHDPSLMNLQWMALKMAPKKPSAMAPVGSAFDQVILRALGKQPMERQSSVKEFFAEFRAVVEGVPIDVNEQHDRRMLAIYVNVRVASEAWSALDDGEEELLEDMRSCITPLQRTLIQKGFMLSMIIGDTRLFMRELVGEGDREAAGRMDVVRTMIELERELAQRLTFDDRVRIDLCLNVGTAEIAGGKIAGGELLQTSNWVPKGEWSGLIGSEQVFAGLGLATEPVAGAPGYLKLAAGVA